MANSYFFHDSNSRNDDKIIKIRMQMGAEGYAIFFMILERLREESNYMSVKDYNIIAFDLRVDTSKVKQVVEDFGLFVFTDDGEYFYSERLSTKMLMMEDVSSKRSQAGKRGMENRWKKAEKRDLITNVMISDNKTITNVTEIDNNKNRLDKNRLDKNRLDKNRLDKTISIDLPSVSLSDLSDDPPKKSVMNVENIIQAWNELDQNIPKIQALNAGTKRYTQLKARINEHGVKAISIAIENIKRSDFLKGYSSDFVINFDWFVKPNNFVKVLEDNYKNRKEPQKMGNDRQKEAIAAFLQGGE